MGTAKVIDFVYWETFPTLLGNFLQTPFMISAVADIMIVWEGEEEERDNPGFRS